uniref:DUF1349 domain-containing protein n=2 Tax=Clytia hemisphaerica TaxID=252671 RepID=A0A7M5V7C6_9CNID
MMDFSKSELGDLKWMNEPSKWEFNNGGLTVFPDEKHDFWRKTYYKPEMINNNGHVLYKEVPINANVMVETEFNLSAINQFDQGGLMVYLDEKHWIKTGIEFADGVKQLSCVVTNDYSDWSTQDYDSSNLAIRLYKLNSDYVVEVRKQEEDKWTFIRICHLNNTDNKQAKLGLFTCAPVAKGGSVDFKYLSYKDVDGYYHTN